MLGNLIWVLRERTIKALDDGLLCVSGKCVELRRVCPILLHTRASKDGKEYPRPMNKKKSANELARNEPGWRNLCRDK